MGDCIDVTDEDESTITQTVPCDTTHTAEVMDVVQAPADLDPDDRSDAEQIADLTDDCPDARHYAGYTGMLTGAVYRATFTADADARTAGARWIACTAVTAKPGTTVGDPLKERATPIKGTLTTDAAFVAEGLQCKATPTAGDLVPCDPDAKNQWLALTYQPDAEPFISVAHQREIATKFCLDSRAKYSTGGDVRWQVLFSATADEGSGQNCLILYSDFQPPS